MKKLLLFLVVLTVSRQLVISQTNTPPLPDGETKIGGHLHAGAGNEVWTDANSLYFNYRGNAGATYFWNLGGSNGISLLSINNNGNVGIGTTSPVRSLHINKHVANGVGAGLILQNENYSGNTGAETEIIFSHLFDSGNPYRYSRIHSVGAAEYGMPDRLSFGMTSNVTDYTDYLTIKYGGNVGVGTTSPNFNLQLHGSSSYLQWTKASIGATATDGTLLGYDGGVGDNYFYIRQRENSGILFYTNDNPKMVIESTGNVGIGTTNPGDYKLNVSGRIRANEVVVNTSGADFVFAPDYKLLSLPEVESFIIENKHLPDLVSAAEIKEKGMNVSEMQTKLLQKIEELTLYIIEQNKKNELQSREIEILRQEVAILTNSMHK